MMQSDTAEPLKLLALDEEDLTVLSAHLQDAVVRVADMMYIPGDKRFVALVNRFDWLKAEAGNGAKDIRRCECALRFDRVQRAQLHQITPGEGAAIVELLAITFDTTEAPGGHVTLMFAGGGAIRLEVECIEAELRDLGAVWETAVKPHHDGIHATFSN